MTQVTPPGWYPDPGRQSDGPPTERWWDGKAWTDQVRPAGSADVWGPPEQLPAEGAYPAYPAHPGYPGELQSSGRRRLRTGIAVGVAAVVLASIGVGVYALTADDGSGGSSANSHSRAPADRADRAGPAAVRAAPSATPAAATAVRAAATAVPAVSRPHPTSPRHRRWTAVR